MDTAAAASVRSPNSGDTSATAAPYSGWYWWSTASSGRPSRNCRACHRKSGPSFHMSVVPDQATRRTTSASSSSVGSTGRRAARPPKPLVPPSIRVFRAMDSPRLVQGFGSAPSLPRRPTWAVGRTLIDCVGPVGGVPSPAAVPGRGPRTGNQTRSLPEGGRPPDPRRSLAMRHVVTLFCSLAVLLMAQHAHGQ